MLRLMRENAGSWIIKILLGIVVLVFIFLGIGPGDTKDQNIAAVVNDQIITMDEYRFAYNNLIERYRSQFGKNLNDEFIQMLGLKETTIEGLIDKALIAQEADRLGVRATDEEVFKSISSIKTFQQDGRFSKTLYSTYMERSRQSKQYVEAKQREAIVMEKIRGFIQDTVHVTDEELKEWYKWEKASVSINYRLFSPSDFSDITLTEEEIKKYYEENSGNYKTEPTVKVSYLKFSPGDYDEKVEVKDSDVEAYYAANLDKYSTPETVKARHILIKVDEAADVDTVEKARLKAMDIYKLATDSGKDFAELAKEHSEGPSKDNGGDLGEFEKDRMVKPFADKAFSMKAGEISEPVKTQFGWHVIKVEKVNAATSRQLAEVKSEIVEILKKDKRETMAYDESIVAYDVILAGDELKQAAVITGIKLKETSPFTQTGGPEEIKGKSRFEFAKTAFEMSAGEISDILEYDGEYYILQIAEKTPSLVQPLEAVQTRVEADCKKAKQDSMALNAADELLTALKSEKKTLDGNPDAKETGLFTRENDGKALNIEKEIVTSSFMLSASNPLPDAPVKTVKGYYLISFKEKKEPDMAGFNKEKTVIKEKLLRQKKRRTFDNWLANLKSNSTIERNKRFFN